MTNIDCSTTDLDKGSTGSKVKIVQNYLSWLGIYTRAIDGDYGTYTVSAVKQLQKDYDCTVDGNFGPKTCNACGINGQDISNSIQALTNTEFEDLTTRRDKFIKENGREPNICYINITNKYRYISNTQYIDMKKRYDLFIEENGRKPNICYINKPASTTGSTTTSTTFKNKFQEAVGTTFTTFKGGYNAIKGRGYIGYNNDIYDQTTALKRLKNKSGLNCSDISQLLYALAKEMGCTVQYVHLRTSNGYGHIVLKVDGTCYVDGAAALKSSYSYGSYWKTYNGKTMYVYSYDDSWLMSDDGVT